MVPHSGQRSGVARRSYPQAEHLCSKGSVFLNRGKRRKYNGEIPESIKSQGGPTILQYRKERGIWGKGPFAIETNGPILVTRFDPEYVLKSSAAQPIESSAKKYIEIVIHWQVNHLDTSGAFANSCMR
jgi:hypothetical protein